MPLLDVLMTNFGAYAGTRKGEEAQKVARHGIKKKPRGLKLRIGRFRGSLLANSSPGDRVKLSVTTLATSQCPTNRLRQPRSEVGAGLRSVNARLKSVLGYKVLRTIRALLFFTRRMK